MDDKYVNYLEDRIFILKFLSEKYRQKVSCCFSEGDYSSARYAFESYHDFGYAASVLSDVLSELKSL